MAQNEKSLARSKAKIGNQNARRTGLYASSTKFKRLRDVQVRYYVARIARQCPYLAKQDLFLLRRFAQLEMLCDVIYAQLREKGVFNKEGEAKRLLGEYRKLVLAQGSLASQLGLSPSARSAIKSGDLDPDVIDISDESARRAIEASGDADPEQRA
jgi:hypothetical protein